jgi:hypothetical protein
VWESEVRGGVGLVGDVMLLLSVSEVGMGGNVWSLEFNVM